MVERDYAALPDGHGLMTYSPLGFGLLAGTYLDAVPAGSRADVPGQVGAVAGGRAHLALDRVDDELAAAAQALFAGVELEPDGI